MRMARTPVWRSARAALAVGLLVACTDRITAPAECPELCPGQDIELVDTVLTGIVASDASFRPFRVPSEVPVMVVQNVDSAVSLAVMRFSPRPSRIALANDTAGAGFGLPDSVALELGLVVRDTLATNVWLLVYRLPATLDSTATYDSVAPAFSGGTLVDSIPIEDTTTVARLRRLLPPALVEPDTADSGVVSLGLAVRADIQTSVTLTSVNSGGPPTLLFYVTGLAPHDSVQRALTSFPSFDTFLTDPEVGDPDGSAIVVGNLPAARALLRFDLPRAIVDSTTVVRATLLMNPTRPVRGRPNEVTDLVAWPILREFGGKSVLVPDTTTTGRGVVTTGSTDTVRVEIGRVLRFWRFAGDSIPRSFILRNLDESVMFGEIEVAGSGAGAAAPRLRVTYIRPFRFGVP